ncbi:MAG: hypothetical protein ACLTW9_27145 [Enterocloster sp.]
MITKEERLSPSIPMMAKRARGRTITQATIILVVRVKGSLKMGSPTPRVIMAASIAFLIFTVPPNSVPLSIKLGGIIYRSFSSCLHGHGLLSPPGAIKKQNQSDDCSVGLASSSTT